MKKVDLDAINNKEPKPERVTRLQPCLITLSNGKTAEFIGPTILEDGEEEVYIEKILFGKPEDVTDDIRQRIRQKELEGK